MKWPSNQVFIPDLSHYEWPADFNALADAGCVAVIYKATEGVGYQDPTYNQARAACYASGMLFGSYHFADGGDVEKQVNNYLSFAMPTADDLICLDFVDNNSNSMSLADAQAWILAVEDNLGRPQECVLYSGNRIKELLGNNSSAFWSSRRLWLCQYTSGTPSWPATWSCYWLWQFTDGTDGPAPHTVAGVNGCCDINAYDGTENELIAEWASGQVQPVPPPDIIATVTVIAPVGVKVIVQQQQ